MNEGEIDEAADRYRQHSTLGKAIQFLSAYRHEVNRKSDGWAYWGSGAAGQLADLILDAGERVPSEEEVRKAIGPIKAFCTKKGLTCPAFSGTATPPRRYPTTDWLPGLEPHQCR